MFYVSQKINSKYLAVLLALVSVSASAASYDISYGTGVIPDKTLCYEHSDIEITVTNTSTDETIPLLSMDVSIYDPKGKKIETARAASPDRKTGVTGNIQFHSEPSDLGPGESKTFCAQYVFGTSSTGHNYDTGNYTLKYRVYSGGQIGSKSAKPVGREKKEPLYIIRPSYPPVDVPILMYHKVSDESSSRYWISTKEFHRQMGLLCALGYETIDFDQLRNYLMYGKSLPEKPVIISLDDAYQNNFTDAFPIMERYGFKGVIFVPTAYIAENEQDRQMSVISHGDDIEAPHLIWPELQALHEAGWSIQSHSETHPNLTKLTDEQLAKELHDSREVIYSHIGERPRYLSYPYGMHGSREMNKLEEELYYGGPSSEWGVENTATTNMYEIKRIEIWAEHTIEQYAEKIGYLESLEPDIYVETNQLIARTGPLTQDANNPKLYGSFTIYNLGTLDLDITAIKDKDSSGVLSFSSAGRAAAPPYHLFASDSETIEVSIESMPAFQNKDSRTLQIYSNDPDHPVLEVEVVFVNPGETEVAGLGRP